LREGQEMRAGRSGATVEHLDAAWPRMRPALRLATGRVVVIAAACAKCATAGFALAGIWLGGAAFAQPIETLPEAWGGRHVDFELPQEVRFLTDDDFPPFNYIDENGNLTGFNIDMARAVCSRLNIVCTIKAQPWDELLALLASGEADAVIASHAITEANRRVASFTDPYYYTPARFVVRSDSELDDITPPGLAERRIGVVKGTAHEAYLRAFFADSVVVTFESDPDARSALRFGKIDALFADGLGLMYWLNGASSRRCCQFRGGVFTETYYFGDGVGIAVARDRGELAAVLSEGIRLARDTGDYEELLLRYFPMSLY